MDLLESNLRKKAALLKEMTDALEKQLQLLDASGTQPKELDLCIEKQGNLTEELEVLNEEADTLYENLRAADISSEVSNASKVVHIQELISQITTEFEDLQEKEQKVRQKMEAFFSKERKNFGAGRRSSKAAFDYYKSMSGSNVVPPQFMDWKK